MTKAYIGLGSNLQDPISQVTKALHKLGKIPHTELLQASPLYRTKPVGGQPQSDYINAVACLETNLSADALLETLLVIEQMHGRVRDGQLNKPRTLDLDLLLMGKLVMNTASLTIPHPRLYCRAFVLKPLMTIAPDLQLPDGRSIRTFYNNLSRQLGDVLELEPEIN